MYCEPTIAAMFRDLGSFQRGYKHTYDWVKLDETLKCMKDDRSSTIFDKIPAVFVAAQVCLTWIPQPLNPEPLTRSGALNPEPLTRSGGWGFFAKLRVVVRP